MRPQSRSLKLFAALALALAAIPGGDAAAQSISRTFTRSQNMTLAPITLRDLLVTSTDGRRRVGTEVSAFFVSARGAVIGGSGERPRIRALMRAPLMARIESDGTALIASPDGGPIQVPSVISIDGITYPFNHVIFAIHRPNQNDVYLQNLVPPHPTDPRLPVDPQAPSNSDYRGVDSSELGSAESRFITLPRLKALEAQKTGDTNVIAFHTDCR